MIRIETVKSHKSVYKTIKTPQREHSKYSAYSHTFKVKMNHSSILSLQHTRSGSISQTTKQPSPSPIRSPTGFPTPDPTALCCDCLIPEPTPQCPEDPDCSDLICIDQPDCCITEWTTECAEAAENVCFPPSDSPTMAPTTTLPLCCACRNARETPLCPEDKDCQSIVCLDDNDCCASEWDLLCAENAAQICTLPPSLSPTMNPTNDPTQVPGRCCLCLDIRDTPGCPQDPECADLVCNDPASGNIECCEIEWNSECTEAAQFECSFSDRPSLFPTIMTPTTESPTANPTINPSVIPTADPTPLPSDFPSFGMLRD